MKAFCECWSPTTNTLHTLVGEISSTTWDLHKLDGLPIKGLFYDEVVPTAKELEGVDDQGKKLLASKLSLFVYSLPSSPTSNEEAK